MKAILRKFTVFTGFFLACIILIMLVVPFFLKGRVSTIVKNKANEYLLADVSFSDLKISLFSDFPNASVSIPDLVVSGVDTFSNDTLVKASAIKISVNLKSLLSKSGVTIKKVTLEKPVINAIVLEDGSANWEITRPDTSKYIVEDTSSVNFNLKSLKIIDATINYSDLKGGMNISIKNWNGSVKGNFSSKRTVLKTLSEMASLSFTYGKLQLLEDVRLNANISLDADFENNKYSFKENQIAFNDLKFAFEGSVSLPDTSTTRFNVKLNTSELNLKSLLSMVPMIYKKDFQEIEASGDVKMDAFIKGDMKNDEFPLFDIDLHVSDGKFKYPQLPGAMTDININARFFNPGGPLDSIQLYVPNFNMVMQGNPFQASLRLSTPYSDPEFTIKLKGKIDLGKIKNVFPLEKSVSVKGLVSADAMVAGKMSYFDNKQYDKFSAKGVVTAKNCIYKNGGNKDVFINNAILKLKPEEFSLSDFSAKIGQNDLKASGTLTNVIPWLVSDDILSGNLNLNSTYFDVNEILVKDTTVKVSNKDSLPSLAFIIPENLNFNINLVADVVKYFDLNLKNVSSSIALKESQLSINKLMADALGGSISINGLYNSSDPNKPAASLGLNFSNVSFAESFKSVSLFRTFTPVFEKVQGQYSLKFDFMTDMDKYMNPLPGSITGKGTINSKNLKVSGLKVFDMIAETIKNESLKNLSAKDLNLKFNIENGKIKTSPFILNIGPSKIKLEGRTGLDKTIDYAFNLTLPAKMSYQGLSSINGFIGGSFDKPTLKIDTKSIVKQAVSSLADDILKKTTGKNAEESIKAAKDEFNKKANEIRSLAKARGDSLISAAEREGNKLIDKANNPVLKAAAKVTAEKLKQAAQKKAAEIEAKAEEEVIKLSKSSELRF
jgi:hypothetical protein